MMTQIFKHAFFNHAFKDILKLIKLGPTQFRSNQNIISSSEDEESNLIDIKPVLVGESSFLLSNGAHWHSDDPSGWTLFKSDT